MTLWERVVGVFRRLRGTAREGKASLRPGKGVEAGGSEPNFFLPQSVLYTY